ncbi:phosphoenolpyruvate synthase/pyruvate phosphate dikinase [Rhizoctonia solani]|uniref:Phosphoenolpyruvate synthase/pyruvate phosphate dikinase n=1 Tax=Rhizoctonia solani TaxID=456999 RepID=A0A0K6GDR8_9AGAM|nr:phosphoenolpyruvate synthase/pyruvate phosphate dikinase [Rhizoctonia solani]
MATSIGDISPEVIIQILHCCEYPSILRFAATCKTFSDLVAQSTSLQLHIELEANGLEIVKGSSKREATYFGILEDLRHFRDSWLSLNFGPPIVRPLGESQMLMWELREGFYIKAYSQTHGEADALQFIPLDATRPDPSPLLFDFTFSEFTADPGQALVAILFSDRALRMNIHVQLCSSTTGLAHPSAQYPRLTAEFDSTFLPSTSDLGIEIMGHMVLIRLGLSDNPSRSYEVLIWNWQSGHFLMRISSREGICDLTFLDHRHLVVLAATRSTQEHLDTLALLVYLISDDATTWQDFPLPRLKTMDYPVSQPILRLEFPKIKETFTISRNRLLLQSKPTPGRILYAKSAGFACPYAITLGMTFSLRLREVNSRRANPPFFRVFLDGKFLLDQLRNNTYTETKILPWSMWGTNATRWFLDPMSPEYWISWMSGSRFIASTPDRSNHFVFDFSSPAIGRFQDRFPELRTSGGESGLTHRYLNPGLSQLAMEASPGVSAITVGADNPSLIDPDNDIGFDEPIVSRLPYRLAFRDSGRTNLNYDALQISGDYVVGVSVGFYICLFVYFLLIPSSSEVGA